VVLASLAIAASAIGIEAWLGLARQIGGVPGTLVSALFLLGIAIANLFRSPKRMAQLSSRQAGAGLRRSPSIACGVTTAFE
jgi:high-affinity nickel permease